MCLILDAPAATDALRKRKVCFGSGGRDSSLSRAFLQGASCDDKTNGMIAALIASFQEERASNLCRRTEQHFGGLAHILRHICQSSQTVRLVLFRPWGIPSNI